MRISVLPQLLVEGTHPIQASSNVGSIFFDLIQLSESSLEGIKVRRDPKNEAAKLMHEAWHKGGGGRRARCGARFRQMLIRCQDGLDMIGQQSQAFLLIRRKGERGRGQNAQGSDDSKVDIHQLEGFNDLKPMLLQQVSP